MFHLEHNQDRVAPFDHRVRHPEDGMFHVEHSTRIADTMNVPRGTFWLVGL